MVSCNAFEQTIRLEFNVVTLLYISRSTLKYYGNEKRLLSKKFEIMFCSKVTLMVQCCSQRKVALNILWSKTEVLAIKFESAFEQLEMIQFSRFVELARSEVAVQPEFMSLAETPLEIVQDKKVILLNILLSKALALRQNIRFSFGIILENVLFQKF
ncbi:Hypothetical_protein [Hexamita inflata]|uniref:Hypothetical_protein n=1 Tax=Hexamita inflata TaxID=28002 RepID=A0AA86R0T0_9EUKA|nr:Hypothetical protein HINF_LOCUS51308 [Hexamita inflata]